ncbi:MAG: flippase [Clostridia bacterium]|nr:flippase [Clostridia bacterium]
MREKSLVKNFIIYFFKTVVIGFFPTLVFFFSAHILGKEGTGRVQFVQNLASYFQLFATFGITSYAIREGAKVRDDKAKLTKLTKEMIRLNLITLSISFVAYVGMFFIAPDKYKNLIIIFAFFLISSGLNLDWFFNVTEDYLYITIRTGISNIIALIFVLLFLNDKADLEICAIGIVFPYVGMLIANIFGIRKEIDFKTKCDLNIKQHIKPISVLFSIIIASSIYSLLDTTMLEIMKGDAAVGLYSAASKLTRMVLQIITSLCAVFVPRLSYYIANKDLKKYRELAFNAISIVALIAIPCGVGLFMFSHQAIDIASGSDYFEAEIPMKILSINLLFSALDGILAWQILVPNNKEKIISIATAAGAITDLVLNFIFIPIYGVSGAAIATLFSELTVFVICIVAARNYIPLASIVKNLFKYFVASLPIVLVGLVLLYKGNFSSIVTMLIAVVVSGIIYVTVLLLIKEKLLAEMILMIKNRGKKPNPDKN